MKSFFKKIIPSVVIVSLVFGLGANIFVEKAKAQSGTPGTPVSSVGQAVGKALGAGAACWLGTKLEGLAIDLGWGNAQGTAESAGKLAPATGAYTKAQTSLGTGIATNVPVVDQAVFDMVGANYQTGLIIAQSVNALAAKNNNDQALNKSKDCIRDVVAKILIDWLVDQTVRWIQGGGEPKFITNWENFLQDAVNVGVGEVAYRTNAAFLCSPFKLQVRASLGIGTFEQRINCTLDKIVGNIDNFYNDFRNGGWLAYTQSFQPQNNYYGTMLNVYDQMVVQSAASRQAAQNQGLASKGFLSTTRCKGGGISQQSYLTLPENDAARYKKDTLGNYCPQNQMEALTPGSIVGEAAANAINADTTWASNIKSWVAALVNAIIGRLINEGLGYMKGSTQSSGGDFDPYGNYGGGHKNANKSYIEGVISDYQNFLAKFVAATSTKSQSVEAVSSTIAIFKELKAENCTPAVSDADITLLETDEAQLITQLNIELTTFPPIISEINANIAQLQAITDFTDQEVSDTDKQYSDFVSKYTSEITEINELEAESQTKQAALVNAQARLASCVIGQ